MPTIAFVSPKGGAGKTTSAFLLRDAIAKLYDVTVIDADPNHPIQTWAEGGNTPPRLTIVSDVDEDTIIERIEDAATKTPFVVVDLEGTASKIVSMRSRRRISSSSRRKARSSMRTKRAGRSASCCKARR
jgi:chromosome partitioning protein